MIEIGSLELPYSNVKEGGIRLMEYQKEVLEKHEKVISISASTGSGKTLAMLKKALDSIDEGATALFLYPTNELLYDQFRSFTRLLDVMGYSYSVMDVEGKIDKPNILVWPVNGQHLEFLSRDKSKGSVLQKMLNSHQIAESKLLILSNIDFIYNLIKGSYYRSELIFPDLLKGLAFVAVDELHMYWGTMFLSLLFTLKSIESKVEHILISSATHTKTLETIFESLRSDKATVNAEDGSGRIVRHETLLDVVHFGNEPYLSSEEHVRKVVEKAVEMLDCCENLLCIFNSVIFTEKVATELEKVIDEEVGRIHGFIPKDVREEMRGKRVVVGTSSIEVGVDFDREGLIFEANNAPSFLQRFGRVGRHRKGVAIAVLPYEDWRMLSGMLKQGLQFRELEEIVWKTLGTPPDYSEIKNSESGVKLYLSYVSSLIYLLERAYGYKKPENKKLKEVLKNIEELAKSDLLNPNVNPKILDDVLQTVKRRAIVEAKRLVEISRVFPRGGLPAVPVLYKKYGIFEMQSINNLEKADVSVVPSKELKCDKPLWLKALEKYEEFVPVFVIEDVNFRKYLEVIVYDSGSFFHLKEFKVVSEWDDDVNKTIEKLLEGLPAHFTFSIPDWRFSRLNARKGNRRGYLIIGGDAYLCQERGCT
jgi:CRISPR-associated helicase Cas3